MTPKTLYLSDLDGTLLQNDATLSPYAREQLNRMMENGLCFSISSARSTGTVTGILAGLRLNVPIALFNGVLYYDYAAARFVRVLDQDVCPQTRWVEGSNYVDVGFKIDPRTKRIIMMGAMDNLVKGAAGQAVQNMNLVFGLDEAEGLRMAPLFP